MRVAMLPAPRPWQPQLVAAEVVEAGHRGLVTVVRAGAEHSLLPQRRLLRPVPPPPPARQLPMQPLRAVGVVVAEAVAEGVAASEPLSRCGASETHRNDVYEHKGGTPPACRMLVFVCRGVKSACNLCNV